MEINTRLTELADTLESEKRKMTQDEKIESDALVQEKEILQLRVERATSGIEPSEQEVRAEQAFAAIATALYEKRNVPEEYASIADNRGIDIPLTRAIQNAASVTPVIPLTIGDIIQPLEKGLILGKLGMKMQYGVVGDWSLPVVAGVEATIEDENAEVADTNIDITSLKPSPKRVAITIPVSNRAIDQSNNALLEIVRTGIVMAKERLLNRWMFSQSKITNKASNGCFVAPKNTLEYTDAITWADVVALKGKVMKEGVKIDGTAAYVCDAATYAALESTPKDAGSGLMILENGKINGFPVFTTEYILPTGSEDNVLGFGVFTYELVAQFGKMRLTVDPYTGANKNVTRFTLNTDYDMMSVRTEAFALLKKAVAAG